MFAKETYKKHEKDYFVDFLKNNPAYIAEQNSQGKAVTLEDMSRTVDAYTSKVGKFKAIRFYLEGQRKPQKLRPGEKTIVFGIVFLTALVTGMTLVWGLL